MSLNPTPSLAQPTRASLSQSATPCTELAARIERKKMYRRDGRTPRKKKRAFWSKNFVKHIEGVCSGIFSIPGKL
jgi:anti-sigma-K factor RskA